MLDFSDPPRLRCPYFARDGDSPSALDRFYCRQLESFPVTVEYDPAEVRLRVVCVRLVSSSPFVDFFQVLRRGSIWNFDPFYCIEQLPQVGEGIFSACHPSEVRLVSHVPQPVFRRHSMSKYVGHHSTCLLGNRVLEFIVLAFLSRLFLPEELHMSPVCTEPFDLLWVGEVNCRERSITISDIRGNRWNHSSVGERHYLSLLYPYLFEIVIVLLGFVPLW